MKTTGPFLSVVRQVLATAIAASAVLVSSSASAGMVVTAAGLAKGFSLSSFATLPSSGAYGAWGSAILSSGNVVVNGYNSSGGTVNYVFTDADGQSPGTALFTSAWSDGGYASSLARLGGTVYGTHFSDDTVRIVNLDGSEGAVVGVRGRGGIAADSARGTLLVATLLGIEELNPTTGVYRYVGGSGGYSVDGVTVSPDGKTVYGEQFGHIYGWDIASGTLVYDSGGIGSPDGVGLIVSGALAGDLIVNDNGGVVNLIDTTTGIITTIASGGSRGDYVGFDSSNGTLFLSQGDGLLRLSLAGGVIGGGGTPTVPEPASLGLVGAALGLAAGVSRRRKATTAS